MIKKTIISKVICATVLLSPLVMTGCETISGLFGESPRYSYPETYGHRKMDPNQRTVVPSKQATSTEAATPTSRRVRHSPAAVPLEAPTVHHNSHSTSGSSHNASTGSSGSEASAGSRADSHQDATIPTTTTVPSVPNSSSTTTVTPATGMSAPTVGQ